jgi:ATP-dependent Lon protease
MDEVLSHALIRQPEPIEWRYDEETKPATPVVADLSIDGDEAGTIAH